MPSSSDLMNSNRRKVVFVTGSSRGIGAAIAARYRSSGYDVLAPSRAELDLGDLEGVARYLEQNPLSVDVLINNAGENQIGDIADMPLERWQRHLDVNITSAMLLSRAAAPYMASNKWGRIVNIGSIFSFLSRKGRAPYAASKAALLGFSRVAAVEWGPDNVLVNVVCPGYVETDLTRANNTGEELAQMARMLPLGRLGSPSEVANAVYFLGSEENTFITGQTLTVDGGFSIQ
jgi:3-oxoacyl-[acyl-carrier protein] reductase